MKIAVFVTIWSAGMSSTDLSQYFQHAPMDFIKADARVLAMEIYTPEPGDVPVMDDVPSPAIIVQIDLDDADAARSLTKSDEFLRLFTTKDGIGQELDEVKLEITEVMNFPLPGRQTAPEREAPLSFVVRYYGPVEDAAQFADFYTRNHPPILAKFPGIRNVLCYLPLDWRESGKVDDSRLIIGNEVVFDNLGALKNALTTDVLDEAQEDSSHFQKYGYSTHHAMHRERVYSR